jgi:hypothetical protein
MTTRREFIELSIAASALGFAHVGNGRAGSILEERPETSAQGWPVSRFLVDGRFPESVAAGLVAEERGVTVGPRPTIPRNIT